MKAIVTLSGGLDSAVLLYSLLREEHEVRCISVDYGQRHKKELEYARDLCAELKIPHFTADMSNMRLLLLGSSQTSEEIAVPEGHYAEESMKQTVVPNRNAILLSLAGAWAVSTKSDWIAYAAHAGDHAIYPDCRPEFAEAMGAAFLLCDWHTFALYRPFIDKTKADIVRLGAEIGVPFEKTYSCYKGGEKHCGRCSTCVERLEAFQIASVNDPTEYHDREFFKTAIKR